MTIPEKVVGSCTVASLGLFVTTASERDWACPEGQEVAIVTLTLSLCRGFARASGSCSSRKHIGVHEKLVIRAL
jgi:hypothetical protein